MLTETKAHNPGSVHLAQPLQMWSKMFRTTTSVFVKNRYDISSGGIQAYYNYGKHTIDDGLRNGQPRDYLFNSKDFNMGITAYQTVKPWQGNDLSLGIDFKHWGGEAWNALKADGKQTPIVDRHVNEIAGYAMMQQALLNDRLSLNAGCALSTHRSLATSGCRRRYHSPSHRLQPHKVQLFKRLPFAQHTRAVYVRPAQSAAQTRAHEQLRG